MNNPILPRDYNTGAPQRFSREARDNPDALPDPFRGPAYFNPRTPADYSPRDKRVWLRKCLHVGCPADRCLEMPVGD